jgi:hypothetical protein
LTEQPGPLHEVIGFGDARMMPIRANIVGPPDVATRIKASHCRLPLRGLVLILDVLQQKAATEVRR